MHKKDKRHKHEMFFVLKKRKIKKINRKRILSKPNVHPTFSVEVAFRQSACNCKKNM